jgi:hypothetical protein
MTNWWYLPANDLTGCIQIENKVLTDRTVWPHSPTGYLNIRKLVLRPAAYLSHYGGYHTKLLTAKFGILNEVWIQCERAKNSITKIQLLVPKWTAYWRDERVTMVFEYKTFWYKDYLYCLHPVVWICNIYKISIHIPSTHLFIITWTCFTLITTCFSPKGHHQVLKQIRKFKLLLLNMAPYCINLVKFRFWILKFLNLR